MVLCYISARESAHRIEVHCRVASSPIWLKISTFLSRHSLRLSRFQDPEDSQIPDFWNIIERNMPPRGTCAPILSASVLLPIKSCRLAPRTLAPPGSKPTGLPICQSPQISWVWTTYSRSISSTIATAPERLAPTSPSAAGVPWLLKCSRV